MAKAFFNESTGSIIVKGIRVKPGAMDLMFRNFGGNKTDTNEAGKRNFCVKITPEDAEQLREELNKAGLQLNIKEWNGETYFKVVIKFGNYPPQIVRKKVYANGRIDKTVLDEDNVGSLDGMLIADGQFSCTPTYLSKYRTWACYLNSFIFTPLVDPVQEEIESLDMADFQHPEDDEVPFE